MLKAASSALGIGAHESMRLAEALYLAGYLSYPRTESTAYPPGTDLGAPLRAQTADARWGGLAQQLHGRGPAPTRAAQNYRVPRRASVLVLARGLDHDGELARLAWGDEPAVGAHGDARRRALGVERRRVARALAIRRHFHDDGPLDGDAHGDAA